MTAHTLIVTLGGTRYRVERPWGDLPSGHVTDVAVDSRGHVSVLLRWDPLSDDTSPRVVELAPDGRRLAAWGATLIADSHMLATSGDRLLIGQIFGNGFLECRMEGSR